MEPAILEQIVSLSKEVQAIIEADFKKLDPYFDNCIKYLQTIAEAMTKFNETRNTALPLPESASLLQADFESYRDYLVKEQKKKNTSPLKGPNIVRESQAKVAIIEREIHNFNLELKQPGALMQTAMQGGTGFKDDPEEIKKYNVPRDMWMKYFYQDEQVSWGEFCKGLKDYALDTIKMDLNDQQLEAVMGKIDKDGDHYILYDEWKSFWAEKWQYEAIRNTIIDTAKPIYTTNKKDVMPISLVVREVNKEDPPNYIYPKDHQFFISFDKIEYNDFDGKLVSYQKAWDKEALIVGKMKGQQKPDIYFNSKVNSIADKQFQINVKKGKTKFGFYITNLSAGSTPTCVKIEKTPYIVEMGMIFRIGDVLIQVEEAYPRPENNESLEEWHADYRFLSFVSKDPGNDPTLQVKAGAPVKVDAKAKPTKLVLKCLEGGDTQEPMTFTVKKKSQDFDVVVGSSEDCEFVVKGLEEKHFKFMYDEWLKFWVVQLLEDSVITDSNGVYLYLIHESEFNDKNTKPKPGKISALMRPGMKISFNSNLLEVIQK